MLFVFDENFSPKIAEGLRVLESGNIKSPFQTGVKHITDLTQRGTPDDEVTKVIGQNGGTVFTKDKDFKTIKALKPLFKEYLVGVIFFKQYKKGLSYWDNVEMLISRWEEIKEVIHAEVPPFVYEVSRHGVQRFEL